VSGTSPTREIEALVRRFGLPASAVRRLATLTDLLASDSSAPTAIREARRIVSEHIADSLVALRLSQVRSAATIVDIGSGPGIPGLPLAIALPDTRVTLLDSNARKAAFIANAVVACQLANARAVTARVEAWADGVARFDAVTARAVARLDVVAEYAAPLLKVGGSLVVWRGRRDPLAEQQAARAAEVLGFQVLEPLTVQPFPGAQNRNLHLMLKVSDTPTRFPRRVGVARKRPLGGSVSAARTVGEPAVEGQG
jgi:16S rRNA (guanine527-N7)-methyltransferase